MKKLSRKALRWLYLGHRWLGIFTCVLFALWFVSGVVMMYVSFPALTDAERLRYLPAIDGGSIRITPDAAMSIAGVKAFPQDLRLQMLRDTPVYRITDWDGTRAVVSAVNGRRIDHIDVDAAMQIATRASGFAVRNVDTIERDQWSVPQRYDVLRPLYRVAIDDADNTEIYISSRTGEFVLDTTRTERIWCWLGHVLHWIYFTDLRAEPPLWRQVVLWVSGAGIVGAVSGICVGILRVRLRRRYKRRAISPYHGWMLWHHLLGLVGGVFVLTWIVSGWLSMSPNQWLTGASLTPEQQQRYAGNTSPTTETSLEILQRVNSSEKTSSTAVHEIGFTWVGGRPLMLQGVSVPGSELQRVNITDARTGLDTTPNESLLVEAASQALANTSVAKVQLLTQEDRYWYSHHQQRVLPVLRVMFDDSDGSWLHIDPRSGQVVGMLNQSARLDRWLFNALHSLDFRFLIDYRPAWDLVVWSLTLAGLTISVSGVVIGWRRLKRSF